MPRSMKTLISGAAFMAAAAFSGGASAIAIVYQGTLLSNTIQTGAVQGDTLNDPARWDFWTFVAPEDELVRVTVRRRTAALDPIIGVWFGTELDTIDYGAGICANSTNTTTVGCADDNLPPAIPGPFGDPIVTFGTGLNAGTYVVAVADHTLAPDPAFPELGYCIQVAISPDPPTLSGEQAGCPRENAVPEPAPLALLGLGVLGLLAARRRPG